MARTITRTADSFCLVLFSDQTKKVLRNKKPKNDRDKAERASLISASLPKLIRLSNKVASITFLTSDLASEHAGFRRLELFFLTCCLVYDSKRHYEIHETTGQGSSGIRMNEKVARDKISFTTNACHSSIITGLKSCDKNKWDSQARDLIKREDWDTEFFKRFALFISLNGTIELPRLFNDFDRQVEGRNTVSTKALTPSSRMRHRAIKILNKTASDPKYTPDKALKVFIKQMIKTYSFLESYIESRYKGGLFRSKKLGEIKGKN